MEDKKIKVIYIASLSHSGSTLLDYLLSFHKDIVGLGEVGSTIGTRQPLHGDADKICSCGLAPENCPVWSSYERTFDPSDRSEKTVSERNLNILHIARSTTGRSVMIDSTKRMRGVRRTHALAKDGQIEMKLVFLVRDARGWADSLARVALKEGGIRRPHFWYLFLWRKMNRELEKEIKKEGIPFFRVSYERLCFDTENTLNEIFSFVGVSQEDFRPNAKPCSHIAGGNPMKKEAISGFRLHYDDRFMRKYWLNLSLFLFPWIFKMNKRLVYPERKEG